MGDTEEARWACRVSNSHDYDDAGSDNAANRSRAAALHVSNVLNASNSSNATYATYLSAAALI